MTDISDEDECEGAPDDDEPEDDDDRYDEYKDGVAMGYINKDGSQREPDEPDFGADDRDWNPRTEDGGTGDPWALAEGETYETGSPF
jgi:hypothetical protein